MEKTRLRSELQGRLLAMTESQRAEKSKKACQNLIGTEKFKAADAIMAYLSLPHEVDTAALILHAWQDSKTIAVPKVSWVQRHMIAVVINTLDTGFATSASGLRNPITGSPLAVEEIDLVITPGLAFDRKGNRLGRGGGYYDRFFAHKDLKACKCGLAFEDQVVDSVPQDDRDITVDMLVTDQEVIYFNTD